MLLLQGINRDVYASGRNKTNRSDVVAIGGNMLKGYRTIIFNLVMTALMVVKMLRPDLETPGEVEVGSGLDVLDQAMVFVWGIGNLFFRVITNTSVGKKA